MANIFNRAKKPIVELTPIDRFVNEFAYGKDWFVEFCSDYNNQMRIMKILDVKEYLAGQHDILKRNPIIYNGIEVVPRKIVLQYAKQLIGYGTAYLIGNKITLSGNEDVVSEFRKVYKTSDYDKKDFDLVHTVNKFGNAYEYVYIKPGQEQKISSKLIDPADSYPVYDSDGQYIAFVEHYTLRDISFYNVYYPDRVEKYSNAGGSLMLRSTFENLSGLPVIYKNDNPIDEYFGRSDLDDYITILDSLEDILSKSIDAYYKYIVGIPVIKGQQLFQEKGKNEGLDKDVVGQGLYLDSDSDFKFESNEISHEAFEVLYKTLMTSLLDISSTPAVAIGKADVSNLSEVSIKLLFSLANMRAMIMEKYIKESIKVRLDKIRTLLEYKGIVFSDEDYSTLDVTFQYAMPQSEKDIIDNLKTLREMKAISVESVLRQAPYVKDVSSELEKLSAESANAGIEM